MGFIRLLIKYLANIIFQIFKVVPIKTNQIFLLNELSYTYGCNPKYLCEYLYTNYGSQLNIVYPLVPGCDTRDVPDGLIVVRPQSFMYFYYIMTSKVVITNAGGVSYIPFRKKQMVINTWHGGGGYKKGGIDVIKNRLFRLETQLNAKKTTYMLASTQLIKDEFSGAFLIDKNKFLETGLPRLDIFFKDMSTVREKVRAYYGLSGEAKIIMYCPSYRGGENGDFLKKDVGLDIASLLKAIQTKWDGDWYFAERLHPKVNEKVNEFVSEGTDRYLNFTKYPDMQELLGAVDLVISDYSGLIWDFSFTKKPCFIFADDIMEYQESIGFYAPIETWPFPIALHEKQLIENILNFSQEEYEEHVKNHHQRLGSFEKGTASQVVGDMIYKYCVNNAS